MNPATSLANGLKDHDPLVDQRCRITLPPPCAIPAPCGARCQLKLGPERHAVLDLGSFTRLAVMAVPASRGKFREQAADLFAQAICLTKHQPVALTPTVMTVFLRDGTDEATCEEMIRHSFGNAAPVTTFVTQPPCGGAALGIELWAAGGPGVRLERLGPHALAVVANGVRWIHCRSARSQRGSDGPYGESLSAFQSLEQQLRYAGVGFDQVVRTWIYVNQITAGANGLQRYQELNRARTDFFRDINFGRKQRAERARAAIYPASTGIGTHGNHITMSCLAIDTRRPDVFLVPLENPHQTPACAYQPVYSPQSPKFARAVAILQGHFVSTLVSGTASIVGAKTVHANDAARQTSQTLDNIEQLIAADNFAGHGLEGVGATLRDVGKLRVYVKRAGDYEACRQVVEQRLPGVPAIYLRADVCRPDLLVEIEAAAFSPLPLATPPAADPARPIP